VRFSYDFCAAFQAAILQPRAKLCSPTAFGFIAWHVRQELQRHAVPHFVLYHPAAGICGTRSAEG
jgi:hypothetical protein